MTAAEVTELVGPSGSLSDLYSFRHRGEARFPEWQFQQGHPLPGMRMVAAALDPALHPLTVDHWMTHGNLELGEGAPTPVEWLCAGRDPQAVAILAAEL